MTMHEPRRFSFAEIFAMFEDARTAEYRSDPERAESILAAAERCLFLTLRELARSEARNPT
jgi:hypothetical protein